MATMSGSGLSPETAAGGTTAGVGGCARAIAVKASRRRVAARIVRSNFAINSILDSPGAESAFWSGGDGELFFELLLFGQCGVVARSEEHTSELQSPMYLV